MDARLIDEKMAQLLVKCKWSPYLRLACDSSNMIPIVLTAIDRLKKSGLHPRKIFVYTLIQDVEESHQRIVTIAKTGVDVFAQPYRDFNGGEPTKEQKRLAGWVNYKPSFKTVTFEEFSYKLKSAKRKKKP